MKPVIRHLESSDHADIFEIYQHFGCLITLEQFKSLQDRAQPIS